jgi:hypothetical protein
MEQSSSHVTACGALLQHFCLNQFGSESGFRGFSARLLISGVCSFLSGEGAGGAPPPSFPKASIQVAGPAHEGAPDGLLEITAAQGRLSAITIGNL